jgi:ssDNA thymidine ADP-ribosyltransferase, DarT
MERAELRELQYITPIANIPSILQHGIVCYDRAQTLGAVSVANAEVQEIRAARRVQGGKSLHSYVCLYFHARNPMLSDIRDQCEDLCVLSISPEVLNIPEVVIADRNAARNFARFTTSPEGLATLDTELVYARWWTGYRFISDDPAQADKRKGAKCAEALIPIPVETKYIIGAKVSSDSAMERLRALAPSWTITVDPSFFFL